MDTFLKTCRLCKEDKSLDDFHTNHSLPDGKFHECKKCRKAQRREAYLKNRERSWEDTKRWRKNNPEKAKAIWRNYYLVKPEVHIKAVVEWHRRNPGYVRMQNMQRRRDGWSQEATDYCDVLMGDPCSYCNTGVAESIDHITSIKLGGNNEWDNLTAACKSCNSKKGSQPLLVFLARS